MRIKCDIDQIADQYIVMIAMYEPVAEQTHRLESKHMLSNESNSRSQKDDGGQGWAI